MKKLYSFVAIAMLAAGASAQTLYVKGSGEGLSWDVGTDMAVQAENGNYTFTIANLSMFKISTVSSAEDGGWDAFNGAAKCAEDDGTSYKDNLGKPVNLVDGDANIGVPWIGTYTVVIPADLSTITVSTDTPEPTSFDAFLRGDMNDWLNDSDEATQAKWKFTQSGTTMTLECSAENGTALIGGQKCKIADMGWGNVNYGAGDYIDFDDPYEWFYNAGDGVLGDDFEGTITFETPEVLRAPIMVTFTEKAGVKNVSVDANAPAEYYNLQGIRVANPEAGLYIVRRGNTTTKVVK